MRDDEDPSRAPERGSLLLDEEHLLEDEELWEDDGSDDYEGWYCVTHRSLPLPGRGLHVRRRLT